MDPKILATSKTNGEIFAATLFNYAMPKDCLAVGAVGGEFPKPAKPSIVDILIDFLKQKFPYQSIGYMDYTGSPAQPGDYKAPEFSINNAIVGWLQQNYTTFVPYSYPNARKQYQSIKVADPKFFDIFHKIAIYEFGYDPLKPGGREAYMGGSIESFEDFNPEVMKIYHSLKYKNNHNKVPSRL